MKRIFALLLALVMVVGMIPVSTIHVHATETQEPVVEETLAPETTPVEETEPVTEETEPEMEATEPVAEVIEPVAEESEIASEEAEPASVQQEEPEEPEPEIVDQGTCGANATWTY